MYIDITTSKSSAFPINTPLIFQMQQINGALFLNANDLFLLSLILLAQRLARREIIPLTTIYASV